MQPPAALAMLEDREFHTVCGLVYRQAGLRFTEAKRWLVAGRLQKRLRVLGLQGFAEYVRRLREDEEEVQRMVESLCTHQTSFFRESPHFDLIGQRLCPVWLREAAEGRRPRRIRALSAACSTGEEAFSIAMTLSGHLRGDPPWEIEVVAGDVSLRALARAERAEWPIERARQVPHPYLREFMLRGVGPSAGLMRAAPALRRLVQFVPINLNDSRHLISGSFDLVFCRNVLIYFDASSRARALRGLLPHLAPAGFLFVGHAESLAGQSDRLAPVVPTVYRNVGPP